MTNPINLAAMILKVTINEKTFPLEVDDEMARRAKDAFFKMDTDMDQGWQMSRTWIDLPDATQRCQIAADKMLTAVQQENTATVGMMAAYIMYKLPHILAIDIDTSGDMTLTEVVMR